MTVNTFVPRDVSQHPLFKHPLGAHSRFPLGFCYVLGVGQPSVSGLSSHSQCSVDTEGHSKAWWLHLYLVDPPNLSDTRASIVVRNLANGEAKSSLGSAPQLM